MRAPQYLDKALKAAGTNKRRMGRVYAVEGMMYSLNDDYDHTIESLKKSIQLVSTCVGTYILLGDAYKEKGDFENAIDALNRARKINPNIAQVYVNLGAIYEEKQEKLIARPPTT